MIMINNLIHTSIISLLSSMVVVLLQGCTTTQQNQGTSTFRDQLVLKSLEGEIMDHKLIENKVLILNLWATWCKPCIEEMPDLEKMQGQLSPDFILLLASDQNRKKIRKFTKNKGFDLQFVQIENSMESLGVYALPTTLIIGRDGSLKETLVGMRKWNQADQLKSFNQYLK